MFFGDYDEVKEGAKEKIKQDLWTEYRIEATVSILAVNEIAFVGESPWHVPHTDMKEWRRRQENGRSF